MIELVLVYCLKADPTHCIERREPMMDYVSVAACNKQAEIVAQQYLAKHPKWLLDRWHCDIDKPHEEPA